MCAAARHALRPQRRGTQAPPYGIFADFVGVGVPDDPFAPHPQKNLSLRTGAHTGVAIRNPPRTAPCRKGKRIPTSLRSSE